MRHYDGAFLLDRRIPVTFFIFVTIFTRDFRRNVAIVNIPICISRSVNIQCGWGEGLIFGSRSTFRNATEIVSETSMEVTFVLGSPNIVLRKVLRFPRTVLGGGGFNLPIATYYEVSLSCDRGASSFYFSPSSLSNR